MALVELRQLLRGKRIWSWIRHGREDNGAIVARLVPPACSVWTACLAWRLAACCNPAWPSLWQEEGIRQRCCGQYEVSLQQAAALDQPLLLLTFGDQ
jgi:hypothetical protein